VGVRRGMGPRRYRVRRFTGGVRFSQGSLSVICSYRADRAEQPPRRVQTDGSAAYVSAEQRDRRDDEQPATSAAPTYFAPVLPGWSATAPSAPSRSTRSPPVTWCGCARLGADQGRVVVDQGLLVGEADRDLVHPGLSLSVRDLEYSDCLDHAILSARFDARVEMAVPEA